MRRRSRSFLAENLPWGYTYTFAVSGDSSNMAEGATVEITLYGKGSMPGEGLPVEVPVFVSQVLVYRQGVSGVGRCRRVGDRRIRTSQRHGLGDGGGAVQGQRDEFRLELV